MLKPLRGRAAFIFTEPNFDVDRLLDFEAMRRHDGEAMRSSAMRAFDPVFVETVRPGDFLVGARNFGYGHPHAPPMAVMRRLGVAAVLAESFAPLYLMGELSAGFPQITCPGVTAFVQRWDELQVDWDRREVVNLTRGGNLPFAPLASHEVAVLEAAGLLERLKADRAARGAAPLAIPGETSPRSS